jgi:hypothetical protein
VLLELVADAQVAEARRTGMHARLDEAFLRQVMVRFEPVEYRLDPRRGRQLGRRRTCGLSGRCLGHRVRQQLGGQLDATLLALRQPLQRTRLQ